MSGHFGTLCINWLKDTKWFCATGMKIKLNTKQDSEPVLYQTREKQQRDRQNTRFRLRKSWWHFITWWIFYISVDRDTRYVMNRIWTISWDIVPTSDIYWTILNCIISYELISVSGRWVVGTGRILLFLYFYMAKP